MYKSAGILLLSLFLLLLPGIANAQCCSTGSPVGASVYVGVLGKNYLRLITFYRHSYSDKYFEADSRSDNHPL